MYGSMMGSVAPSILCYPLSLPPPYTHTPHAADSDTLMFIDFRADRMRQIVEALGIKPQFETDTIPQNLVYIASPFSVILLPSFIYLLLSLLFFFFLLYLFSVSLASLIPSLFN